MSKYKALIIILITSSFIACKKKVKEKVVSDKYETTVNWKPAHSFYLENITETVVLLDSLKTIGLFDKNTKEIFKQVRVAFKKAEPYASHLQPSIGHRVNGPALPIFLEDSGKVIAPIGLQKLEETIYEGTDNLDDFYSEIKVVKGFINNLKKGIGKHELNPKRFFIATHQQLMRIVSLAMAGFDTPVSGLSITETVVSLESLKYVYENSIQKLIINKNSNLNTSFIDNINKAIFFAKENPNFENFDQYTYIRDYLNPLTRNWVSIRKETGLWDGKTRSPFNFNAPTFFEEDSFDVNYFLDSNTKDPSNDLIALGKKLFNDKKLSKSGKMACVTCHNPKLAYTDGSKFPVDNLGRPAKRNTPTLLNAVYQKAFFWDGRTSTINAQIKTVFKNKSEFNSEIHKFSTEILKDSTYIKDFKKVFGKIPNHNKETISAIAAYISTLNSFNSKFDKNIRGEEDTYTETEKNGFNLFMGKALCATCHFMPLTNGTVPPFFTETEKEVIGVPEKPNNKKLNGDVGFYTVFGENIHKGMFKTPTVRNAALTAPYMHNGVYNTLEEVMNFYNLGGGAGLGFQGLDHQTLPFDNLDLSEKEISELIAFIKTLNDNTISEDY